MERRQKRRRVYESTELFKRAAHSSLRRPACHQDDAFQPVQLTTFTVNTSYTTHTGIQHAGHPGPLLDENITLDAVPAYLQELGGSHPDRAVAVMQKATRNISDMTLRRPGVFRGLERAIRHVSFSPATQLQLAGYLITPGSMHKSSPLHRCFGLLNDICNDLRKTGALQIAPEQVNALHVHLKGRLWNVVERALKIFQNEFHLDCMKEVLEELLDTCLLQALQPATGRANTLTSLQGVLYHLSNGCFDDAFELLMLEAHAHRIFAEDSADFFWRCTGPARRLIFQDALRSATGVEKICDHWLTNITIDEAVALLHTLADPQGMDEVRRETALDAMLVHYGKGELNNKDFKNELERENFVGCIGRLLLGEPLSDADRTFLRSLAEQNHVEKQPGMVLLHPLDRPEPEKLLNRKRER